MRTVVQRVSHAQVKVDGQITGSIQEGLLLLVGFGPDDSLEELQWMARKIVDMRIFNDENGLMNKSLMDVEGQVLVVSQFTLFAQYKKGNRPSFISAAKPHEAIPLYEAFVQEMKRQTGREVATGIFGADMKVELLNDGPVTICMDSKNPM